MKCFVIGCNNSYERDKSVRLFSLPRDVSLREKWVNFCGQNVGQHAKICSDHFLPEDFVNLLKVQMGLVKHLILKKGAVPSLRKGSFNKLNLLVEAAKTIEATEEQRNVVALERVPLVEVAVDNGNRSNKLNLLLEAAKRIEATEDQENAFVSERAPLVEVDNRASRSTKTLLERKM
ncbi:PREDICTED: uncharacterized protein LOC108379161 [Rhagoletis zephyria]|uniref:uncharacterized protein LOC108379161 n=1 Tax=Rhagoletis zephyria TaxID=28612 RepID=UPI0008112FD5|nr:PREDICTED: uncharacterized protein LOC108379161 [Rhagoletis zephyria]